MDHIVLHRRLAADLSTATVYALLRLRVEVFVVEQGCPYQELDGRDLDLTTRHYWLAPYGATEDPQATLRLLEPTEGEYRIGRVCVAAHLRSQGAARRLLEAALAEVGGAPCLFDVQAHLTELYTALGLVVAGPEFTADGVAYVPMRRNGSATVW
ncbi:MAG TPA: GNAT family N-acetyltransferase [Pseudonocardiaceae bacterium]